MTYLEELRTNITKLNRSEVVCVVGQGYVGLPLAKAAHDAGYKVVGYDTDRMKWQNLLKCVSPIEDVTDEELAGMDNYIPVHEEHQITKAFNRQPDIWIVTVPTPLKDGKPDLTYVIAAGVTIGRYATDKLVILESTVAPGTTRGEFLRAIQYSGGRGMNGDVLQPGEDFSLGFSPERIDPGNKDFKLTNTEKIVAGATQQCQTAVYEFYRSILEPGVVYIAKTLEIAETAKLLENTFRHVNIALVNELTRHCYALGIDVWEVINAASTKPYGFMPFYPGPGVGGHCLPVDPAYLGDKVKTDTGDDFHFVDLAMRINDSQPKYVVDRLIQILNGKGKPVNGSSILVLGYAYKPNTGDARETPAEPIVRMLSDMGAELFVVDPHTGYPEHFKTVFDAALALDAAQRQRFDAILLQTNHDTFRVDYQMIVDSDVPTLDTRGVMPPGKNIHRL